MTTRNLDDQFEAYLARDDDALTGSHFFEILAEIEQRRVQETIEVTMRVIGGQVEFQPCNRIDVRGNELWVDDKRIVVKMVE
jgi:hypothetical protein